ncbi:Uma2 family endonuclease [Desertifilum sp. FACHB-1129]|uniref:Uma2 family endonuclease n=3 Tax=Cyanophyceae TaxID=3028117 RepID=A0ACD5GPC7_9CYAN|nr:MULTISPECIES: Uma2 family endonuclease [Cyanophyceae]MCD8486511.1 Uma2 family endonuclease [Desertifilum sp.]MDA0210201.1 Uma2 family endonuclease [Cyanobacteria bacterium FC1]MBD2313650.1 Uma2 family endonuclease [Desertifilum sp. FACHB-1129]MBD2320605.1 Uma2 family endonuclease [Desertifilum sp. FACHB-866]MBD2330733.1 Uma2 family endonuclease [Desertifilum sp. FACHB-868]
MVNVKPRFESFAEYLLYENRSEKFYELFNGELIEMPPESGLNVQIANRLFLVFALMLGTDRVRAQGLELEVKGEPKNRYPDLTIIREEHIQQLSTRNTIRLSMLPPLLVVEIVSPGEIQRERDYIAKRIQYQDCQIPEYWIVDPQLQAIIVLELIDSAYTEVGQFKDDEWVISPGFRELNLKVSDIFITP